MPGAVRQTCCILLSFESLSYKTMLKTAPLLELIHIMYAAPSVCLYQLISFLMKKS